MSPSPPTDTCLQNLPRRSNWPGSRDKFARVTRASNSYDAVVAGIRAAIRVGLQPVKVNVVIMRGFNEDQILDFVRFSRSEGVAVRFIEFMPLEEERIWSPNTVVGFKEMRGILAGFRPLVALNATAPGETALRYTFDDGSEKSASSLPFPMPFVENAAASV